MGVKWSVFLLMIVLFVSACSTEKTKPVVTDITGAAVQEDGLVDTEEENGAGENETTQEEAEVSDESEGEEILPPGTHVVTIKDLKLDPKELTIMRGDTVVWKHEDTWEKEEETRHYLAAHTNEFRTPILYYGDTFEHTFNNTGTFTYIDVIYKEKASMRGRIVVE